MTIQQKVFRTQHRINELRQACRPGDGKRHFYSLLYDAVRFTADRMDQLDNVALVGYIELAAIVMGRCDVNFLALRTKLTELGFNTAPPS